MLRRKDFVLFAAGGGLFLISLAAVLATINPVLVFLLTALALASMAALVGEATDHLGNRFSPGATGAIQSALGNLPELFFGIFALKAGLNSVVQAALIGSMLANGLLVLGIAFLIGGIKHGPQRFGREGSSRMALFFVLAVAILAIPSITAHLHVPVAGHERALSLVGAVVLLVLFALSIPATLEGQTGEVERGDIEHGWPMWLVTLVLVLAGAGSAFVADWFVAALTPALQTLHINPVWAALVIVSISGNAVENFVGIQMMAKNKADYAVNVVMQSVVQIPYLLLPALVIISAAFGLGSLTLVFSPLLLVILILSAIIITFVIIDGESTWLEGACLVALYVMVAAAFWWG